MSLSEWQWGVLTVAAFCTGLSKTGIAGVGVLSVALFASALPGAASTGALLPLLLSADLFGLAFFRKHASWPHLWKLFPWVMAGVVAGCFALEHVRGSAVQRMIGGILLGMVGLHFWRKRRGAKFDETVPHAWWLAALTGVLAGFTTMVANAAGPVMVLYLLAVGLPKLAFVGTGAWFFMLVNAFKVPFSVQLGLITPESLRLDFLLLAPMIPGALLGPVLLRRMNQEVFEKMVLLLTLAASLGLTFG